MYTTFKNINASMAYLAPLPVAAMLMSVSLSAQAVITESSVQSYASAMKQAANSKNVSQIANLVADDALISLSRKGKTTSLDKQAYLKLLQDSWATTTNYHYDINITNVVTSGEQAKADVNTIETWTKDGKQTTLSTAARATLKSGASNAVLLRAVAQVTIE